MGVTFYDKKNKIALKIFNFIPQRYEVPTSLTIFVNGSGRNWLNLSFRKFAQLSWTLTVQYLL